MAFAKMKIRLPGKPSHTHTQTLLHLPVLLVRISCRSEGKVACEVACSDLVLWNVVLFVLALQIYLVNCRLL